MEWIKRAGESPRTLAVLSASFNPLTLAHVALAHAGLTVCEQVLFVLPRIFPHKGYEGASLPQRVEMLRAATAKEPGWFAAISNRGLFVEIASECRAAYHPAPALTFLCGRDAAERIVNWDYGRAGAVEEMLQEFQLLVAARDGQYDAPSHLRGAIGRVCLPDGLKAVSASDVRRRIARGEPWRHLVPESVQELAWRIYGEAAQ